MSLASLCLCIKFNLYNPVGRVLPVIHTESTFLPGVPHRAQSGKDDWIHSYCPVSPGYSSQPDG